MVVVRGLHRPFILIHHHKTKILLNRALPSLFPLSLSLSLVVVVGEKEREKESDIKSDDECFYSEDDDFFPERFTITKRIDSRHTTLDDDAKQHNNEEETTNKQKRRRRRGSNSRTRWVFSNSHVSLLFTMLVYVLDISMLRLK